MFGLGFSLFLSIFLVGVSSFGHFGACRLAVSLLSHLITLSLKENANIFNL